MTGSDGWQFWIDRGGTFTDVVARAPDGALTTAKLLSENPAHYADAAVEGMRRILGLAAGAALPADAIAAVKMGTTVATNALLERAGEPTVLVTNAGFADVLRIGTQNRPDLFKLAIELPEPLYARVVEVPGRIDAQGEEVMPLDPVAARAGLEHAFADGLRAAAIVFMHGYRFPAHERRVAEIARDIGFTQISVSHEVSPLIKYVARGDTTVVDAYLSPILGRYVARVAAWLPGTRLMFMQSNGGLTDAMLFRGKDAILSGPAGGVVGAVETAHAAGFDKVIGFDMGGTSTDVSHYAGAYERAFDSLVAGVRVTSPIMRIHTVAAGGGSILAFDGARFRVGPQSAGADPGPACYGKGGPLTVTDANVMLGRLPPDHFPQVFGPTADRPLDVGVVREKFAAVAAEVGRPAESVADGFLTVAVETMAAAIKRVSVQRGYDVSTYTLVCFGGAGGQHACRIADALGMETIFIHTLAGVLSAYGMGLAPLRAHREAAVGRALDEPGVRDLARVFEPLEGACRDELRAQGLTAEDIAVTRLLQVRYAGTDTALEVAMGSAAEIATAFEQTHRARFGFTDEDRGLEIEAALVEAVGTVGAASEQELPDAPAALAPQPTAIVKAWFDGKELDAWLYTRDALPRGVTVAGPAIIAEANATTVIEPGWRARVTPFGHLVLTRLAPRPRAHAVGTDVDPVRLEVFNNLFMSVAEQMGAVLANTASSVNIKERLDFSCAVFDADGGLIANAPHLPVHLGSMGDSVRAILRARGPTIRPGQVFALNAPYNGGTHLPDITVITPIFDATGRELLFFVGSRGHHADVGGISPGSMPPFSRRVEDEGVLIDDFLLVERGRLREVELRALLASGPHPARNPDRNIADFRAQIAANARGAAELHRLVEQYGLAAVRAYMGHVRANAAEAVRRVLDRLPDGAFTVDMDFGGRVAVAIRVDQRARRAVIDFTGTSVQTDTNYNAPLAVTRAAVLYTFRCLVHDDIPLNDGCLEPLQLIVPEGSLLNPKYPAAVVAGNVETSQAVTAALLGAAGAAAASQGTMNNLTFGNAEHQYYETICGGAGAGPGFAGASAVHTHMTNTRLTDPEVLEWRHPVLVESFAIRRGSGGPGKWPGGDGVVRRLKFLQPMSAAMLAQSRRVAPFGLAGGAAAKPGRTYVQRTDGRIDELAPADETGVGAGDIMVIETPGGGGYGAA
jgi:5-oxoprolinase (ATP-hydrolysing)